MISYRNTLYVAQWGPARPPGLPPWPARPCPCPSPGLLFLFPLPLCFLSTRLAIGYWLVCLSGLLGLFVITSFIHYYTCCLFAYTHYMFPSIRVRGSHMVPLSCLRYHDYVVFARGCFVTRTNYRTKGIVATRLLCLVKQPCLRQT